MNWDKSDNFMVQYFYSANDDDSLLVVGHGRKCFYDQEANELYYKLTGAKTEPGCMVRNIWGTIERGKLLCKDCGHTYESKCPCNAVKKMQFLVEE